MSFLNPALLFLGLAVAVPLVLHLLHRHQGRQLVFPALRYLRRAEKEHARRIKLRQLLLLALRMAILLLVALAAAGPFLTRGGTGHEPTAVAIIIDNSLSSGTVVGERRVLDTLKARALETLTNAGADDRFWLIRAGTPWEPAVPGDAQATMRRVRETQVSGAASNLGAAISRARTLLAAGAEERPAEIHLLSDLQATALDDVEPIPDDDELPLIVWVPEHDVPGNAAVTDVDLGGGLAPRSGQRSTVGARFFGVGEGDSIPVRLVLDGRVSAAAVARTGEATVLPFPSRAAGWVSGWVEIDPDALRGDDRRYFVTRVQPPPTVALTQPHPFVREALSVLTDANRLRRVEAVASADIVLAPGAVGIDAVRAGRTVVVFPPASRLELPAANRRLAAAGLAWRFSPPTDAGEARFAPAEDGDQLLAALGRARLHEFYELEAQGEVAEADSVLLELSDETPWAIGGDLPEGGRFILLGSSMTPQATTLPTSSAMIPLLDRIFGVWAAREPASVEVTPGDRVHLPPGADAVERPDGTREAVPPGSRYRAPAQAGIYRFFAADRPSGAFAVNPSSAESELERMAPAELRTALSGGNIELVDNSDAWTTSIFHARHGRDIWRPLIILALAILLLEGLIAAAGRGGAKPRGDKSGSAGAGAEPRGQRAAAGETTNHGRRGSRVRTAPVAAAGGGSQRG